MNQDFAQHVVDLLDALTRQHVLALGKVRCAQARQGIPELVLLLGPRVRWREVARVDVEQLEDLKQVLRGEGPLPSLISLNLAWDSSSLSASSAWVQRRLLRN